MCGCGMVAATRTRCVLSVCAKSLCVCVCARACVCWGGEVLQNPSAEGSAEGSGEQHQRSPASHPPPHQATTRPQLLRYTQVDCVSCGCRTLCSWDEVTASSPVGTLSAGVVWALRSKKVWSSTQ